MGWNTSAFFVHQRSTDDLLSLLPGEFACEPTGEHVGAEEATANRPGGRLYLAADGAWCQLWDPDFRFVSRTYNMAGNGSPPVLAGTRALAVLFSSVTSTYGFWLHDNGEVVRRAIYESGELIDSLGEPLPAEADITFPEWGPDEDFVWAIMQDVTGLTSASGGQFAVYNVTQ